MKLLGFDNEKYLAEQTAAIIERVSKYPKLYLEFGGKLLFDHHAKRVLPGYDPNVKMRLLQNLKNKTDVLLCVYAGDIERKKMRADFGITYDADTMKMIDDLHEWDVKVAGVVITRYEEQPSVKQFINKLERRGVRVYAHYSTCGYPDIECIVSRKGYGAHEYVETTKPLVVVTGPGPGSGKLSTCLALLYHDYNKGKASGYAKFETFPIWNLPVDHPVNLAYEAATADIGDRNLVDPFHLEKHGESVTNYNRDIASFPILKKILEKITGGKAAYCSPTDMGVNRAGFGITDDEIVREASKQEIIRRFFRYQCEYSAGLMELDAVYRTQNLMEQLNLKPEDRPVVSRARKAADDAPASGKGNAGIFCGAAIQLHDGRFVTGKNSPLLHAASSLVLNAIKTLAEIPDKIHLLLPNITASIGVLKRDILNRKTESLDLEETLIALSISATTNPAAQCAMDKLKELADCEVHMTHIPTPGDEMGLKRLGVNLTSDPNFSSKNLFIY